MFAAFIILSLVGLQSIFIQQVQSISLCQKDYKLTNYNLYCTNPEEIVIVTRVSASFVSRVDNAFDCVATPKLNLNVSNTLSADFCAYCFNKQPTCVISHDIVDKNRMFDASTYNIGDDFHPKPASVGIYYECINKSILKLFSPEQICLYTYSNPDLLHLSTTTTNAAKLVTKPQVVANENTQNEAGEEDEDFVLNLND